MKRVKLILPTLLISLASISAHAGESPTELMVTEPVRFLGTGYGWGVSSLDVSQDGEVMITGGSDFDSRGFVHAWRLESGALAWTADLGHVGRNPYTPVIVRFSPNEELVLVSSPEIGVLRVLASDTGQPRVALHLPRMHPLAATFRNDGKEIAILGRDTEVPPGLWVIAICETATGELLKTIALEDFPENTEIYSVAFSTDGDKMIPRFVTSETTARVWEVSSGRLIQSVEQTNGVLSVALSTDGRIAATGSKEGISVWATTDGSLLHFLPSGWPDADFSFSEFSTEGHRLLTFQTSWEPELASGGARLWDLQSGEELSYLDSRGRGTQAARFFQNDTRILVAVRDVLTVWDATSFERLSILDRQASGSAVAFSPDGSRAVAAGALWDWRAGRLDRILGRSVDEAAFSTDGNRVSFTAEGLGHFATYDTQAERIVQVVTGGDARVTAIAFSSTGEIATGNDLNRVRIWDSNSGSLLKAVEGHRGEVNSLDFTPDGRFLLIGGGSIVGNVPPEAVVYDLIEERIAMRFSRIIGSTVLDAKFSPDGKRVVTGTFQSANDTRSAIQVWDAATGSLLRSITVPDRPGETFSSVAFSPDGSKILSGGLWGRLWDADTGQLLRVFVPGLDISSVAFSPEGTHILTSRIGSAAVWDLRDLLAKPRFVSSGNGPEVHWDLGTLQYAPTLQGPWTDLPTVSPFVLAPTGERGFFRVKVEP